MIKISDLIIEIELHPCFLYILIHFKILELEAIMLKYVSHILIKINGNCIRDDFFHS